MFMCWSFDPNLYFYPLKKIQISYHLLYSLTLVMERFIFIKRVVILHQANNYVSIAVADSTLLQNLIMIGLPPGCILAYFRGQIQSHATLKFLLPTDNQRNT